MLAVDASFSVAACLGSDGFSALGDGYLVAPPLMWSETRSTLHLMLHRAALSSPSATAAVERLENATVEVRTPPELGRESWRIADELGWARTYDAEYVALASILGCRLVTLDARMRRGAARLGFVVAPSEL